MHTFLPLISAFNDVKFSIPHAYSTRIKIRQIAITASKANRTIHACVMTLKCTFTALYALYYEYCSPRLFVCLTDDCCVCYLTALRYDEFSIVLEVVNNISSLYIRLLASCSRHRHHHNVVVVLLSHAHAHSVHRGGTCHGRQLTDDALRRSVFPRYVRRLSSTDDGIFTRVSSTVSSS